MSDGSLQVSRSNVDDTTALPAEVTNQVTPSLLSSSSDAAPSNHAPSGPASWTTPAHNEQRKTVIKAIIRILLERRPYADAVWRERIAKMAKKLEARLYFTAACLEDHMNMNTLRHRIQRLAAEVIHHRRGDSSYDATGGSMDEMLSSLSASQPTAAASAPTAALPSGPNVTVLPANPTGPRLIRRFVLYRIAPAS